MGGFLELGTLFDVTLRSIYLYFVKKILVGLFLDNKAVVAGNYSRDPRDSFQGWIKFEQVP